MLGSLIYKRLITATSLPPPTSYRCGLPALNYKTVSTFNYNHYLPCIKVVTELKIISYHTLQNSSILLLVSYIFQSLDHHLGTGNGELWKQLKVLL